MQTTLTLATPAGTLQVVCDGMARDNLVPSNLVLTGCRGVTANGYADVKVWSIPVAWVVSYVMGYMTEPEEETPRPA